MSGHAAIIDATAGKATKRTRDATQLAKFIADMKIGEVELRTDDGKNAAAVALGRKGGLKGGIARAQKLSAERKREIASKAAKARWSKDTLADDN